MGLFQQCPHKYYRIRVKQDIKEPPTDAIRYGLAMHKAAEDYIGKNTPLPPAFEYLKATLDKIAAYPGKIYCEYKMALTRKLEPCAFDAPDAWWRGIADVLNIDGDKARILDYKTGKSAKYADSKQLELLSLATFKHFPQVKFAKGALLFVVANSIVPAKFHVGESDTKWVKWVRDTVDLEHSLANGAWNPRPNFTCSKWCAVHDCIHNGRR